MGKQTSSDQSNTCRYRSKLYGYTQGCRCDECVAARAAYMKRQRPNYDYERRVGRRAEQKRAWDRANLPERYARKD